MVYGIVMTSQARKEIFHRIFFKKILKVTENYVKISKFFEAKTIGNIEEKKTEF